MNIPPEVIKGILIFCIIFAVFMWSGSSVCAQLSAWKVSWHMWTAYAISFVFAGLLGAFIYAYNQK